MATSAASVAKGSISMSTGFFAQITSIKWSGITRTSIETSHMGLAAASAGTFGNRTFIKGNLVDPGEIEVEFNFNPDTLPIIGAAAETVTVTWGDSATPATWAATGFMTKMEVNAPLDDKMTATATVKLSGAVTKTAGT